MFFRGSRYELVRDTEMKARDGRVVRYKRIRFIPNARGTLPYRVAQEDRLDVIAFRTYRDPEQFWRIADANLALVPDDLVAQPGRILYLPIPQV
jgi:hypothetical protein